LERVVSGSDSLGGVGKRIDALLRTRSHISSLLFCEIKTPGTQLLQKDAYRPGVFSPAVDLRGGVAQVQKTTHIVTLKAAENHRDLVDGQGSPTGEVVTVVRPRGVLVVGSLAEFEEEHGVNYERFASFELFRNGLHGVDVVTFDELLERARFIVRHYIRDEQTDD
jgi:hypothetical protein